MFTRQVHPQEKCPSVLALVIKYSSRMANIKGKSISEHVIVKFPDYFHLL